MMQSKNGVVTLMRLALQEQLACMDCHLSYLHNAEQVYTPLHASLHCIVSSVCILLT